MRQLRFDPVNRFAHVLYRLVGVEAGGEFQHHVAAALESGGRHFLDPLDASQLFFKRADHEAFRVLGGDPLQMGGHENKRDIDVGLGLLGDGNVSNAAADENQYQYSDDRAGMRYRGFDQFHALCLLFICRRHVHEYRNHHLLRLHEFVADHHQRQFFGQPAQPDAVTAVPQQLDRISRNPVVGAHGLDA